MARNSTGINSNDLEFVDSNSKGSKIKTLFFFLIFLLVWIGIFALLIKLDVGGFGSSVMRPIFKDVPIIKEILPEDNSVGDAESQYKSLADAITYIKELEVELQNANDTIKSDNELIAELRSEVERLKIFEQQQEEFEKLKEKFYDEVVFGDSALDYNYYKVFYESINPDYAEVLYKQVLEKYMYNQKYRELANVYSEMKPKKAAAALYEMTGNLEVVVAILENMETDKRAAILDALSDVDAVFCGKITVMLVP